MHAELHALARLLDVHDGRDAVEERQQHRRRQPLEAQHLDAIRMRFGNDLVVAADVAAVGAHVHARPARDRARPQQEARDRSGRALLRGLAARQAHEPLFLVDLVAQLAMQLLELRAVGGVHRADAQRSLNERVGPRAVDVEEPDRLGRQEERIRHEVREWHALEQPEARQPLSQLARDDAVAELLVLIRRRRLDRRDRGHDRLPGRSGS